MFLNTNLRNNTNNTNVFEMPPNPASVRRVSSRRRSAIEGVYANGLLSGAVATNVEIRSRATTTVATATATPGTGSPLLPESVLNRIQSELQKHLHASLTLRARQVVSDIRIRSVANLTSRSHRRHRICAPHLPDAYDTILPPLRLPSGSPLPLPLPLPLPRRGITSARTKTDFSLAESLWHSLCRCDPTEFRGAVMPYTVDTNTGRRTHANLIYLDFDTRRDGVTNVTCYLFEPNGVSFTKTNPTGLGNLQRAWHYVCQNQNVSLAAAAATAVLPTTMRLKPRVHLVGEHLPDHGGLQTLLGSHTTTDDGGGGGTRRTRKGVAGSTSASMSRREGYAVCGAVTLWLFHMWLRAAAAAAATTAETAETAAATALTLDQFYTKVVKYVETHRATSQAAFVRFMRHTNDRVARDYAAHTKAFVERDVAAIQTLMRRQYDDVLKRHGVRLTVDAQLGIRGGGGGVSSGGETTTGCLRFALKARFRLGVAAATARSRSRSRSRT
jgi:hypothetical protein